MTKRKYLARVTEDEDSGDMTIHVLNETATKALCEGGEFVDELLEHEIKVEAQRRATV